MQDDTTVPVKCILCIVNRIVERRKLGIIFPSSPSNLKALRRRGVGSDKATHKRQFLTHTEIKISLKGGTVRYGMTLKT